jgi:hypothetical protein
MFIVVKRAKNPKKKKFKDILSCIIREQLNIKKTICYFLFAIKYFENGKDDTRNAENTRRKKKQRKK